MRPAPFERTPAMRLRAAYFAVHRRANALFLAHDLTADQFVVLSLLERHPWVIQSGLAKLMSADANTVTAMLRVLERRGFVRREPDPADRRARRVSLTAAGRRARIGLAKASAALHRELDRVVAAGGFAAFTRTMDRITALGRGPVPAAGGKPSRPRRRI